VLTTYGTVRSEYNAYRKQPDDGDSETASHSAPSTPNDRTSQVRKEKQANLKGKGKAKDKPKLSVKHFDRLFQREWNRIVLGIYLNCILFTP
jgi:hypothetical protein